MAGHSLWIRFLYTTVTALSHSVLQALELLVRCAVPLGRQLVLGLQVVVGVDVEVGFKVCAARRSPARSRQSAATSAVQKWSSRLERRSW